MSRLVRVAGRMVELAGLDQVWLGVDHLANSKITLYYPKGPVQTIEYKCGEWGQADKDATTLKEAKALFDKNALSLAGTIESEVDKCR
jgi:uncharacterized protein YdeI (BOF family)